MDPNNITKEKNTKITIIPMEGDNFIVNKNKMLISKLIETMLGDNEAEQEIYLPDVKSATLCKVIEFCEYYSDGKLPKLDKPLSSCNMEEIVPEWFANFVDLPNEELFALIMAAKYMNIEPLLHLGCAKVASMIKGKTLEEICKNFKIINDFTPEEEAEIRDEYKFCDELW